MWRIILSFWFGNEKLWKAFWIVWFGCNIVIATASNAVDAYNANTILRAALLIIIPIQVWVIVSVWRCAPNTSNKIWCWAARGMIILYVSRTVREILETFLQ